MYSPHSYTPRFKAEVIRTLLGNFTPTAEASAPYKVPVELLRLWLRETVENLDAVFEKRQGQEEAHDRNPVLSRSEVSALLAGDDPEP